MASEYALTNGPSREELFDCLRLGHLQNELQVIDFWGQQKFQPGARSGASLSIEIEGIHRAGDNGREWFFWGRRKQTYSGVPNWKSIYISFAFGRWNTYHRRGIIRFGQASFFVSPITAEEMAAITEKNI